MFVSRRIPAVVEQRLRSLFTVEIHDDEQPSPRQKLAEAVAGAHGLIVTLTDRIDGDLLDAAGPQLRVVANYAAGYDNVDISAATKRAIVVANTPDVLTDASAEFTLALMLAASRRLVSGDRLIRRRLTWAWAPTFMLGTSLAGRRLGIVGLGAIGRRVATLAEALGMSVVHTSRTAVHPRYPSLRLDRLLSSADVVSLHCPLTPDTRHLIGARELALMSKNALLINTSRGAVVDEAALAAALAARRIAGAALDVYEYEPQVRAELLGLDNVVLAPHLASATVETREAMGMLCVDALEAVLCDGRPPANALNAPPERGS